MSYSPANKRTKKNKTTKNNNYGRAAVEPRYKQTLNNEVLGLTNDFLCPRNSKTYGKEPRYNETSL